MMLAPQAPSSVPATARVVVIGAGIVGNSLVHHLARLGWRDIVQIDKGALPNPGGSTGHASNFIFPVDHSRELADLTLDSMRQYKELGVFTESGGYEVARTEERMEELRRRMSSARAWGVPAELVTPDHVVERVPFLDKDKILGAFWCPSVGVVDSLRAGTLMRESALALGALTVVSTVEVVGMDVEQGRIRRVRTTGGDIEAETVVIACGVWSPKLAKMAGASIPLTPAVHQMISVGPIPQLAERPGEISFPIVRDMDTFCYERQHGADMEVGSYAHRPILYDPDEIPSIEQAKLSPTEMPFTADDFDPQLEQALRADAGRARRRRGRDPLRDQRPALADPGRRPAPRRDARGEGPVVGGRGVDQGGPRRRAGRRGVDDPRPLRDRRAPRRHRAVLPAPAHPRARAVPHVRGVQQDLRHRAPRRAVVRRARQAPRADARGAARQPAPMFFETVGWERPFWYASNEALLGEYGDRVLPREHEWDARWWSPIINAEHLAMRERAGHRRPVRVRDLRRRRAGRCDGRAGHRRRPGRRRRRPRDLHAGARRQGRLPLRPHRDAAGPRPLPGGHRRPARHGRPQVVRRPPARDGAAVVDQTSAFTTIGLWGPRARDILGRAHRRRHLPRRASRSSPAARIELGNVAVLASRISYVGELGWELYVPMEQGARVWDLLHEAGRPDGAVPVGIGVYGTTGRLEKGYRAYGFELDGERTIVEAGMARPKVKDADFVGREAYLAQRDAAPQSVLCTLTVDDHTSAGGGKRYMLGGEPILTRDGGTLTDGHGHHPYVTSAGSAPSLGKHVLMAYLPPDQAVVGNALAVSYMEELYPVTVGATTPPRCSTRPTSGSRAELMTNVLVCIKRVPDAAGEVTADRRRPGRRRPVRRVHGQRARELRGRAGGADRRGRPAGRRPC